MYFLFDENMPIRLAKGLQILDKENDFGKKPVHILDHISEHIAEGAHDIEVVKLARRLTAIVVSQDDDYKAITATSDLVKKLKIGYVLFKAPKKSGSNYEDIVRSFITAWPKLKESLHNEKPPFMCIIERDGKIVKNEKFRK